MKRRILFGLVLSAYMVIVGCKAPQPVESPQYDKPLPPGQYALRKITDPSMIPDMTFACYNLKDMREGIQNSLSYMSKPSSKQFFPMADITHERVVASLKAMAELIDSGLYGKDLQAALRSKFEVYQSVGCDDKGTVLFTGYYTPIFDGSLTASEKYRYPLYKQPQDLVKNEKGDILGQRMPDGTMRKYPDRREIEQSGMLKGQEIAWLTDPFEVYIANVQGSALLRTPSGEMVTLGYAANNGHEYNSIGKQMIKDGVVPASGLSLKAMIDYFKANPQQVEKYIYQNPRYVFFRTDSGNPRGCLNEPVLAMRSIATDKAIYPRASIAFLQTRLPRPAAGGAVQKASYTGFALDQDAGGAIRAPGRCDVYIGVGDEAGKMAGHVYEEGKLYYLFLRPDMVKQYISPQSAPTQANLQQSQG